MVELFEQFLKERQYLKNVTRKTLIWYQTAFQAFARLVTVATPADLNRRVLQAFVIGLRQRGVAPVSCNTYAKALNSFFKWLHSEGHLPTLLMVYEDPRVCRTRRHAGRAGRARGPGERPRSSRAHAYRSRSGCSRDRARGRAHARDRPASPNRA